MAPRQLTLFESGPAEPPNLPEGLSYAPDVISPDVEAQVLEQLPGLPFKPFEFQGYLGKRRVVSFGWRYDFNDRALEAAEPLPGFLVPLRQAAAAFAGIAEDELAHALVTEYAAGAAIGWHRDRPEFHDVVGISLLSPCIFRMRRKKGSGWERASFTAAPRSAYVLRGPARREWEHSIPAVDSLRYSVTFRQLKA